MTKLSRKESRTILLKLLNEYKVADYFINTLISNGAIYKNKSLLEVFDDYTIKHSPKTWIVGMGLWSSTTQGSKFWRIISDELMSRINIELPAKKLNYRSIW